MNLYLQNIKLLKMSESTSIIGSSTSEFVKNTSRQSDSKLFYFLQSCKKGKTPKSENEILMSTRYPKPGTYYVPKSKMNLVAKYAYKDIQNRSVFYATEQPDPTDQPFRFDVDLKTVLTSQYSGIKLEKIYLELYKFIVKYLKNNFKVVDKNLICFVLTKRDTRQADNQRLQGIHLHMPFARGTSNQLKKITESIMFMAENSKLFTGELSARKAIDPIETKNWTVYGSCKENMAYHVTNYLATKNGKSVIKKYTVLGESAETVKTFLLHNVNNIPLLEPTEDFLIVMEQQKQDEIQKTLEFKKRLAEIGSNECTDKDVEKVEALCMMLDPYRFDSYDDWMKLGCAINKSTGGSQKGFEIWQITSERMNPDKFADDKTDKMMRSIWNSASEYEGQSYTIGSLKWWAERDSPQEYDEWRRITNRSKTEEAIRCFTEGDLADLAFELFGKEYEYTTKKNWFKFTSKIGHWLDDEYGKAYIWEVFRRNVLEYLKEYIKKEDSLIEYMKNLKKLKQRSFINNCIEMSTFNFNKDPKFEQKLDEIPYLIGDLNGVYDLNQGVHRIGVPEDFVSKKCNATFRDYTWNHPHVKSAMRFWAKIHVDPEIRHFFLKIISTCFEAGNREKVIIVMSSPVGNNGKSVALKVIESIWGDYTITLQRERFVLSTMKSAGGASPDIANAEKKRIGTVKELGKDEPLDIGVLKLFSGSDDIQVRTLYEKGGDMKMMLTLIMMFNKPPCISGDKPTWNRMRLIPFESEFSKDAPDDPKEQWRQKHFKADKDIEPKLDQLKDAFYWIFLEYYKIYKREGLDPLPKKVQLATQAYKEENDIFEEYVNQELIDTQKPQDKFEVTKEFYENYIQWFTLNTRGKKMARPSYSDFKRDTVNYFFNKKTVIGTNKDGKPLHFTYVKHNKDKFVYGVRLRQENDEDEEEEEDVEDSEEDHYMYKQEVDLEEEQMNEKDYDQYFVGPTFLNLDSSDTHSILMS